MTDTVLVTGAASGMGATVVERLAGAGWRVPGLPSAPRPGRLPRKAGGRAREAPPRGLRVVSLTPGPGT